MSALPYTLYRAEQVRALDRVAIDQFGIPGIELMNRAGGATFDVLRERFADARRVIVICGGGNNGGDGFVIARLAHEANLRVTLVCPAGVDQLHGDANMAWGAAKASGLTVTPFDQINMADEDVIVDAMFGTGLDRPVAGEWAHIIDAVNAADVPVVAVDIPSGLHADSGETLGAVVSAELTITFIGMKIGLLIGRGPEYTGEIVFNDLQVPADVFNHVQPFLHRVAWSRVTSPLAPRPRNAHKGLFGHVLAVGGSQGMGGAIRMTAQASMRCGAGLTSVALQADYAAPMAASCPEVMWHGVTGAAELGALLPRATVIAIGPGLGQSDWGRALLATVLASAKPLVVDADALNLLADDPEPRSHWVLTPHPGEAARLLGCSTTDINGDRLGSARGLAERYQAVVVLKGAGTLIAAPDGRLCICTDGNPGMATGGMGDVLTGVIAALVAQGVELFTAASMGVALHAAAGDVAAKAGQRGLTAGDVISAIRELVNTD